MSDVRVLVIEDEPKIAALLRDYLQAQGWNVVVHGRGDDALDWFRRARPDVVLLDLMLPGKDGLEVCRELRAESAVPLMMITARIEEIDRLLGLELGADDYVCKPFSPREVVARVRALLRRARTTGSSIVPSGRVQLDDARFLARVDGVALDLTPVEFRLLRVLAAQPGRVLSRGKLMSELYLDHRVVSDRTVDSHVKNLRRKISDACSGIDAIDAVYGVGYRFALEEADHPARR